jgi:sn-glycerol 3-phosphate transport system permease protein
MIFITLLFPLEARIIPSYQVVARLNMLDSYSGLILPMISSATGTFFFRQFYRSIPDELLEACQARWFWAPGVSLLISCCPCPRR